MFKSLQGLVKQFLCAKCHMYRVKRAGSYCKRCRRAGG